MNDMQTTQSFTAAARTFWIAHGPDTLHDGVLEPRQTMQTGLPYLETYPSQRVRDQRIAALRKDYDSAVAAWRETLRLRDPFAKLADHRWRHETAGLALPGGQRIQTTRESQAQITAVVNSLQMGLISEPVTYKLDSGWADLTAAQVMVVAQAVGGHVKACFKAERSVAAQLETLDDPASADVVALFDAAYFAEVMQ
ncbi:MAG: DUF4376 domain-containing protein [Roseovarius sp.]